MPTIPGVPTIDPVNKPQMNPAQAGRPGEVIAQSGEAANDETLQQQNLDLYLKKAQEHVDTIAARNQMDAAYTNIQNELSKTQNSRDVPDVIAQGNKTLNDISSQWSKSPASVAIQQDADSLRPGLSRVGTVRQVDLMGKELKINLTVQAERLASDYAAGNRDGSVEAFSTAVGGGVKTGLLGTAEAGEYVRQFKIKGQELELKNSISNPNPDVNQKAYDDINQHPEKYPDLTGEQLDVFKGQALGAFEAHTRMKDWAEGQMALKTMLVPKIGQFTNPATGMFDEGAAMADNAERFAKGEITDTQSKVLAEGFASHEAQLKIGYQQEASKRMDDIEKDLSSHNFSQASDKLEASQDWFEQHGMAKDYQGLLRYTSQKRAEVRAEATAARTEARFEYFQQRQIAQDESADQLGVVQHFITGGGIVTKADLQNMAGTGKGKLSTHDVDVAWKTMQSYESQPDFKAALDYADSSFKIPKGASADQAAAQNKKYAETVQLFQQQVNAHPDMSKLEIMHNIVKSQDAEKIKQHADAMFGTGSGASGIGSLFTRIFGSHTTETPPAKEGASAPIVQHSPSSGKDRYSMDGGKTWLPGKPPQQ
jgi:hypothetical protein